MRDSITRLRTLGALRIPLSDVGCPLSVCGPRAVVVMM